MTQAILTLTNQLLISNIQQFFKNRKKKLLQRAKVRQTFNELSKLTNRELNDIGLSRSDIRSISMEAFYDDQES